MQTTTCPRIVVLDADPPVVRNGQVVHDGESEAAASGVPGAGRVQPREAAAVGHRDPGPLVGRGQARLTGPREFQSAEAGCRTATSSWVCRLLSGLATRVRVRDEPALLTCRVVQPGEQVVEGPGQPSQSVVGRWDVQPAAQVAGGDLRRLGAQVPHGPQRPPGQHPDPPGEQGDGRRHGAGQPPP